ncbi:xanthine phosphoribosyltransferase [Persicimonas caeni]|uniref:Xanthine phosphoribosyltransferase n=1 Tax=Persicimonas caeni TaxID=2292766 RepID=A0A4Y6PMN0_PERCE|nr:xanthine phosphoribosyltransferase [Persicimonas caeni]QDG49479.1 xanthine phosphoribosyltransferase [Persicimonas caeni]QED30700.1 xanthine phosphoribosyltransferase [Persicimonas caeni]
MSPQYHKDLYISWEEFHRDARRLCEELLDRDAYKGIVAVTRGGLIPASIVARELGIRLVDTICVVSYHGEQGQQQTEQAKVLKAPEGDGEGMLLIDDLVDTGKTARTVRECLPKATFATVYAKPKGRPLVDTCVREVSQDTWIRFPWDTELHFAVPLADKARKGSQDESD